MNKIQPSGKQNLPRFASWTIKHLLPRYLGHTAIGDYEEIYSRIVDEQGSVFKARLWLWRQVSFPFSGGLSCLKTT